MDTLKDYLASCVIADGKRLDDYTRVYFQTNEDLCTIFYDVDFQDKDVLSVLASSDQVFTARYLGARKVDSFDKNSLALYYYYLRLWTIQYRNLLYPEPVLSNDYRWILQVLKQVQPRSEEEKRALVFWGKHLRRATDLSQLFFEKQKEGRVLFTTDDLVEHLNDEMVFQNINFFEENEASQDYDIILFSNIMEWARGSEDKIICIRDNIDKFLRQDGIVLCSNLANYEPRYLVRKIFDSNFDFIDLGLNGYAYQKR